MSYERFARQYRFEPPSGFPLTLPCTSIVHHLSGPSIYAHARHRARMPQRAARGAPQRVLPIFELSPHSGFNHPSTCAHVRLLGPCFKTGRIAPERHTILDRQPPRRWGQPWGLGTDRSIGTPSRPEPEDGPFSHDPCRWCGSGSIKSKPNGYQYNSLASNDFTYCFTFFSKSFSSFPHGTCSLSVSHKYLALEGYYLPISAAVPSNTTHKRTDRLARPLHGTGLLPSPARYHKSDLHSTLARFAR